MGSNPLWKQVQRKHCRMLGGTGENAWRGESGPDSRPLEWLVVESKERKQLPKWLTRAVTKTVISAGGNQLGIVILHEKGMSYDEDVVCMQLADFVKWFGV